MILYKKRLISEADLSCLIKDAFLSPPWHEILSEEECQKRAASILTKRNVQCCIAEVDGNVAGVILTDTLTLEELHQERGAALVEWASQRKWETIGWGRETLLFRKYQSLGIGTVLREEMMNHLTQSKVYSGLLTRMRDDNVQVIKIAEKFGYLRTGVRVKSSFGENIWHEFWYRTF